MWAVKRGSPRLSDTPDGFAASQTGLPLTFIDGALQLKTAGTAIGMDIVPYAGAAGRNGGRKCLAHRIGESVTAVGADVVGGP